ncbi:SDR family NAD(P)-dependent oxidoreductase [Nonomuraea sediminis]|uniref:SDR family NAD(P)-dependent oxidoreductase n=1 Tax=Nonomuraea sediminis TaxID=2835864 RepID=UPI001BDD6BAF|nr:SDR family NAD(P)-dependent oxidoreductase [Nonomuraea sediminis]
MSERIALVTGASRGVGRAVAEGLAERGMTVISGMRTPSGELSVRLDVTDPATISAAAAWIEERFGRLDVLVNNAGISGYTPGRPPGATTVESVREVFETNVLGVVAVTNAMLPLLRRSPAARIVNVSSAVGSLTHQTDPGHYLYGLPPQAAYPASKAALNALTVQYARELAGEGILVNAVTPGPCDTDFTRGLGFDLGRTAQDGARAVVRLATVGPDGPTGGFFDENGRVPW